MKTTALGLVLLVGICGCSRSERPATSPPPKEQRTGTVVDRDNTAVNERDRNSSLKTPLDQNENQRDINTTADIRKRVVDTDMSINAQNVKIITQNGKVTLRGPVKSAAEKKRIEDIAHAVAGAENVQSELEVE